MAYIGVASALFLVMLLLLAGVNPSPLLLLLTGFTFLLLAVCA